MLDFSASLLCGILVEGGVAVVVEVDEARGDDQSAAVDCATDLAELELADGDDLVADDATSPTMPGDPVPSMIVPPRSSMSASMLASTAGRLLAAGGERQRSNTAVIRQTSERWLNEWR